MVYRKKKYAKSVCMCNGMYFIKRRGNPLKEEGLLAHTSGGESFCVRLHPVPDDRPAPLTRESFIFPRCRYSFHAGKLQ